MSKRPKRSCTKKEVSYKEEANWKEPEEAAETAEGTTKRKRGGQSESYRSRLLRQGKELCKDPPTLPPDGVRVLEERAPAMTRRKDGTLRSSTDPEFRPNLTPAEVLQRGSFGGTYFRPIVSAVTNERYGDAVWREFPSEWFRGLDVAVEVASPLYRPEVNRYGVKCGTSLDAWESSGWISEIDPYGWFQWYCRYYLGRRSTDDKRQIQRWLKGQGPKGRWRCNLANKVLATGAAFDDPQVSPVVRQTCQHWAYVLTQADLDAHRARTNRAKTK